jgi:hypothetical protein
MIFRTAIPMSLSRAELEKAVTHLSAGDWQAAHQIAQQDEDSAVACWAHGIVHIMEGDIPNARYWYGRAKRAFPAKPDAAHEIRALTAELRS